MRSTDNAFTTRIRENLIARRLAEINAEGLFPYNKSQDPVGLDEMVVDGRKLLQVGSTNYLGLARDPRVVEAVKEAVQANGTSCTASRVLSGTRPLHLELESELADFFDKEAAIVFATGYLANIGALPVLVGRHDLIVYDAEVHACLIDGMQLSGADCVKFAHNDVAQLEAKLVASAAPRKLILVDSVYSLAGDLAPLREILDVAERHGAWVYLDDAHGAGVLGPGGKGLAHAVGVQDRVPILMGVFSKSFASTGGFIAGSRELIEFLRFGARSYMFSNAIAPAQAAAALAALRILRNEPERAELAMRRAQQARSRLREQGWRCGGDGGHLVSVVIGKDVLTLRIAKALAEHGVWVGPAVSPGVPAGKALLRTNFPPTLTDAQFECAMDAFEQVSRLFPEALTTREVAA